MNAKKKKQLQEELDDYKAMLADEKSSAEEKTWAQGKIEEITKKLEEPEAATPAAEAPSGEAGAEKSKVKKERKKREPKAKKERKSKDDTAEPDCDTLLEKFRARRAAAKASAHKTKTKSIFEKVADKIESAVVGAVKSIPKEDIKESPSQFVRDVEVVERNMKRFLQSFKTLLGKDYEASEVTGALKGVEDVVDKLKKKYSEKK